jgi:basic membrane protein A
MVALGALALLSMPVFAACGSSSNSGPTTSAKTFKIGLVTDIGGLNDKGFNHLADVGLEKAKTDFPNVKGDVLESHTGDDYVPNLTHFASQGYDLVIAVGFLMQQAVGTVAGQFPNVHFAIIDGAGTDANFNDLKQPNVSDLFFHEEQAGALAGVASGMLEKAGLTPKKTGVVSTVGGQKIPPVDHYIAGFQWGATHEDPTIKTLNGYSNDFSDPTKCAGIANSQIGAGSEIVFQVAGGCGLGALQAAGQKGVWSIGVDADQKDADKSMIASAIKRVDTAAYDAIQSVVIGSFTGGQHFFDLTNDGVGLAPGNQPVPSAIQSEIDAVSAQIKSGAITVPNTVP